MKPVSFPSRYHFVTVLGQGGMGTVYLAQTKRMGKLCALKTILPTFALHEEIFRRFIKEAEIGKYLNHRNIVSIYDCFLENRNLFIEMEYVPGRDLQEIISRCSRIPPEVALRIVVEICEGLDYAHNRAVDSRKEPLRIVHRDISPSNVLISAEGDVKITDFGIAKATLGVNVSMFGTRAGKLRYMAPETLAVDRSSDHRVDVFACGVLLYEMITGIHPYDTQTGKREFVPPSELTQNVTKSLDGIVERAMHPNPDQRTLSADALKQELQQVQAEYPPDTGYPVRRFVNEAIPDIGDPPSNIGEELPPNAETFLPGVKEEIDANFRRLRLRKRMLPLLSALMLVFTTLGAVFLWPVLFGPRLGDAFLFHVAYASSDGKQVKLWMANPDGSGRIPLHKFEPGEGVLDLHSSPSGDRVFFNYATPVGFANLATMDRKGRMTELTPSSPSREEGYGGAGIALVSPDKQWLGFVTEIRNRNGWGEIFRMKAGFRPDLERMKQIIRSQPWNEFSDEATVALRDIGLEILTRREDVGQFSCWTWSPDGQRISFAAGAQWNRPSSIWVMDADGKNKKKIHQCRIRTEALTWTRQDRIAFTDGERPGKNDIFLINPDGSELQTLVSSEGNDMFRPYYQEAWVDNGTWIIFESNRHGNYDIFQIDTWGQNEGQLTYSQADERFALYSPEKNGMFFYIDHSDESLWKSVPGTRDTRIRISPTGERVSWYCLVPNPKTTGG